MHHFSAKLEQLGLIHLVTPGSMPSGCSKGMHSFSKMSAYIDWDSQGIGTYTLAAHGRRLGVGDLAGLLLGLAGTLVLNGLLTVHLQTERNKAKL
jgi:hypothetical protein